MIFVSKFLRQPKMLIALNFMNRRGTEHNEPRLGEIGCYNYHQKLFVSFVCPLAKTPGYLM